MALFDPGFSTCALCGRVLNEDDDLVATSHFITDETDPLWRYSDALMHRACFLVWESRQDFVDKYNAEAVDQMLADGTLKPKPFWREVFQWMMRRET
jgi:hypothetical protein